MTDVTQRKNSSVAPLAPRCGVVRNSNRMALRSLLLAMLLVAAAFLEPPEFLLHSHTVGGSKKVLFIGNSFTFGHNIPCIVEQLSRGSTQVVSSTMVAYGGVTLDWHLANGDARATIAQGPWDYIVLQDCSFCTIDNLGGFQHGVAEMTKLARAEQGTPVLFMTWADENSPEDIKTISNHYLKEAAKNGAKLAPVGLAWQRARSLSPSLKLYESDGHHGAALGALLSTFVLLDVLGAPLPEPTAPVEIPVPPDFLFELAIPRKGVIVDQPTAQLLWQAAKTATATNSGLEN